MNDKKIPEIKGKHKIFFGMNKDGEKIYLTKPSWDCGWYWGFGYLGNKDCHYHLSGYADGRNINMYNALKNDYELAKPIKDNLWVFCELMLTAYTLGETAAVMTRGGAHITTNPLQELIQDDAIASNINKVILPAIFNKLNEIYTA